jgi:hypothetical protein
MLLVDAAGCIAMPTVQTLLALGHLQPPKMPIQSAKPITVAPNRVVGRRRSLVQQINQSTIAIDEANEYCKPCDSVSCGMCGDRITVGMLGLQ